MAKEIEKFPGYCATDHPTDAIQHALSEMGKRNGLTGLVLIQFDLERVGCRSWGITPAMMREMDKIGTRVLRDILEGRHDPLEHMPAEGRS